MEYYTAQKSPNHFPQRMQLVIWDHYVQWQYDDVIMGAIASQITSLTIVYSTVYSGADQRKYQSSSSLAFERGIHRGPVNSPQKWSVTRNVFPFHDVIMISLASTGRLTLRPDNVPLGLFKVINRPTILFVNISPFQITKWPMLNLHIHQIIVFFIILISLLKIALRNLIFHCLLLLIMQLF